MTARSRTPRSRSTIRGPRPSRSKWRGANATLAAARRFASVTTTDYVPDHLERGRRRAEAEGFDIAFEVADTEALPYSAASFDVVLSTFGVMFAPDHAQAASELMRVCRPGGRIGQTCWTPTGFLGQLFRVVARHVPPIPGVRSPLLWGSEVELRAALRDFARLTARPARKQDNFFVDTRSLRDFSGDVEQAGAVAALDPDELEGRLVSLARESRLKRVRKGSGTEYAPGVPLKACSSRKPCNTSWMTGRQVTTSSKSTTLSMRRRGLARKTSMHTDVSTRTMGRP